MAESGDSRAALTRTIVMSYLYIALWISLSFSVIVFNKYILDTKLYNWPFPISLTMIHMAFCSLLAVLLIQGLHLVQPADVTRHIYLTSVLPIGALYALSLWFSNSAYIYLSVSFIQMLKALMPVAVYSIGVSVQREPFSVPTFMNMLLISFGVAIAAAGEANFNLTGFLLQLAAVAMEATRLVLIQVLLKAKGINLNPITSLYYIAPACFAFLTIPWFAVELPILLSHSFQPDLLLFGTNCLCAFALNVAVFLLIGKTSALTMNVAGVVKDWLLIAFSWSIINDRVTTVNLLGYLLAFAGVCWYNNAQLKELQSKQMAQSMHPNEEKDKLLSTDSVGTEGDVESNARR